mmetsp:Transcript_5697/g.14471  ORF Transcript_5697/g.14471 Transcript_5697/m.14471 type:complete len:605 (-) Transcript_5697:335-2149(-)|eukprot:CAMPEP_0177664356 /NCGR_PEP_ID=MMETSP0447-20121125/20452_1 /TAXON_ID=0 /ORGANISM="Stygamoeba regulata, Strain BSH-02190019" /LENGTH=604 /DNA_ID=CAMNT_0019170327 /DNA_START=143 /DNA_END=1957 /DNA_ORIENTATION=-
MERAVSVEQAKEEEWPSLEECEDGTETAGASEPVEVKEVTEATVVEGRQQETVAPASTEAHPPQEDAARRPKVQESADRGSPSAQAVLTPPPSQVMDSSSSESSEKPAVSNGGWGWGGWVTSAFSSVNELVRPAVDEIFKPAYESVSEASTTLVKQMIEEDAPSEDLSESGDSGGGGGGGREGEKSDTAPQASGQAGGREAAAPDPQAGEETTELDIMYGDLKGLVSGTSRYFSSMFQALEDGTVVERSVDVGAKFSSYSLSALEHMGKTAADLFVHGQEEGGQDADCPTDLREESDAQAAAAGALPTLVPKKVDPHSFRSVFEGGLGIVHLQALELLGNEALSRSRRAKLTPPLQSVASQIANVLSDIDGDVEREDIETVEAPLVLSAKALESVKAIEAAKAKSQESSRGHLSSFSEAIDTLQLDWNEESPVAPRAEHLVQEATSRMDAIVVDSIKLMADYCAATVQAVLHACESFLIKRADGGSSDAPAEALALATYVRFLLQFAAVDLTEVSMALAATAQSTSQMCATHLHDMACKSDDDASKAAVDSFTTKLNETASTQTNSIYMRTGDAIAILNDTNPHCANICVSLLSGAAARAADRA